MRSIPLRRPELLVENGPTEEGHIYVAEASAIPSNMDFNRDALMVCAARDDRTYTKARFPLFVVPGSLAEVFNLVAEVYDRYDQWDRSLQQILNDDARPLSLLQASLPILGNTLYLNDNKMNFIGKIIGMDRFHLQKGGGNGQSDSVEGVDWLRSIPAQPDGWSPPFDRSRSIRAQPVVWSLASDRLRSIPAQSVVPALKRSRVKSRTT